jgi:hypothetical protein
MSCFPRYGFGLMLQKNPKSESVRNQQQRHNRSWNEVRGSQPPRQESGVIGLVESVQQIGSAPEIESMQWLCRRDAAAIAAKTTRVSQR